MPMRCDAPCGNLTPYGKGVRARAETALAADFSLASPQ